MCNFLSALVMKNGDILCNPEHTDSHCELVEAFNIRDNTYGHDHFVKVEFLPPKNRFNIGNLSTWELVVDQRFTPSWYDKESVRSKLEAKVRRMFVDNKRKALLGGCYILLEGANITRVKNSRIINMTNNTSIEDTYGHTVVENMIGTSTIVRTWHHTTIQRMHDYATVKNLFDYSNIIEMLLNSRVTHMNRHSKVNRMHNHSTVESMIHSSKVRFMFDSSRINKMEGSSEVKYMEDNSRVFSINPKEGACIVNNNSKAPKPKQEE